MEDIATIIPLPAPGVAPVCRLLSETVFTTAGGGAEVLPLSCKLDIILIMSGYFPFPDTWPQVSFIINLNTD